MSCVSNARVRGWFLRWQVFSHPSLRRAKNAIAKRRLWKSREPQFIRLSMLQVMVSNLPQQPEDRELTMLVLAAYVFMLRLPSEALPMAARWAGNLRDVPVFKFHSDKVELWLPKRKNRLTPSSLFRPCWCSKCTLTCPVHVLGAYMAELPAGTQPFVGISPAQASYGVRRLLAEAGVPEADKYTSHDLRRGHADDMRRGGATLGEILRAGDWRSPAFLAYLEKEQLEFDRVCEAFDLVSEADDECDE